MRNNENFPRTDFFFIFKENGKNQKRSDLPKKKVGFTEHPIKILAGQVNAKVISSMFCCVFDSVRALENYVTRASACLMNSVRSRDAQ